MKDAKPEQIVAFLTGHRDHFNPIGYGTPMTDIVERLRDPNVISMAVRLEAADEIERLRLKVPDRDKLLAEIEQLRAVIAYMNDHADSPTIVRREARRALEPKP